jgi:hypothetical protein
MLKFHQHFDINAVYLNYVNIQFENLPSDVIIESGLVLKLGNKVSC